MNLLEPFGVYLCRSLAPASGGRSPRTSDQAPLLALGTASGRPSPFEQLAELVLVFGLLMFLILSSIFSVLLLNARFHLE